MKEPCGYTCNDIDGILSDLRDIALRLEDLRRDNAALREWGREECNRADELEAELINQREKCDKMENTICDLQAELLEV